MAGTSSCVADCTVGAFARGAVSTLTVLRLSVNVVTAPDPVRDQPSGTSTVNRPDGSLKVTNTWLSGMSPAGLASDVLGSTLRSFVLAAPLSPEPPEQAAVTRVRAPAAPTRV